MNTFASSCALRAALPPASRHPGGRGERRRETIPRASSRGGDGGGRPVELRAARGGGAHGAARGGRRGRRLRRGVLSDCARQRMLAAVWGASYSSSGINTRLKKIKAHEKKGKKCTERRATRAFSSPLSPSPEHAAQLCKVRFEYARYVAGHHLAGGLVPASRETARRAAVDDAEAAGRQADRRRGRGRKSLQLLSLKESVVQL